jgi:glutathione-regulated potassium-efflux system ancillary protein KefC
MSGRSALEALGFERHQARTLAMRFRRHNVELVEQMRTHSGDQDQLIAIAKQGRQQLEEQFAREREEARQHRGLS